LWASSRTLHCGFQFAAALQQSYWSFYSGCFRWFETTTLATTQFRMWLFYIQRLVKFPFTHSILLLLILMLCFCLFWGFASGDRNNYHIKNYVWCIF
jgi:hypothetical protein